MFVAGRGVFVGGIAVAGTGVLVNVGPDCAAADRVFVEVVGDGSVPSADESVAVTRSVGAESAER